MQKSKTSQPVLNIASKGILIEPDEDMTTETSLSDLDLQVPTKVPSTDVRCTRSGRICVPLSWLIARGPELAMTELTFP